MTNMSESEQDRWQAPSFPDSAMPTAGELEQLQKQAYDEAFAEASEAGKKAGYEEGMAAAKAEVSKRVSILDALVAHLQSPLSTLDDELEAQIVRMVVSMTGRLFRRQIDQDPDAIRGLVRDAVKLLPNASSVVQIHVHPSDAERLNDMQPADSDDTTTARWSIVVDAAITTGGCRVVCGRSNVDATVESRIESIANSLIGDQRS
ncbi:MAG: flagellar assembly protein FliH [Woeseiaceae bacterium]